MFSNLSPVSFRLSSSPVPPRISHSLCPVPVSASLDPWFPTLPLLCPGPSSHHFCSTVCLTNHPAAPFPLPCQTPDVKLPCCPVSSNSTGPSTLWAVQTCLLWSRHGKYEQSRTKGVLPLTAQSSTDKKTQFIKSILWNLSFNLLLPCKDYCIMIWSWIIVCERTSKYRCPTSRERPTLSSH